MNVDDQKKLHVLMVVANAFTHDPRVYNEACSLLKAGYTVTVLAWDKSRKYLSEEQVDGIWVNRSFNTKFMDMLPFDIFRLHLWWRKGLQDALSVYNHHPFDVIHCHDFSSLPIGVKLKKKLGVPLIYDAHEIWGEMVRMDLPGWWADYYLRKERQLIDQVDCILTVNEPVKAYLRGISSKSITIIMNCKPLLSRVYTPPKNKVFTVLYLGSLHQRRFVLELAQTVGEIPDIHCIIGGAGKSDYVKQVAMTCSKFENVEFRGVIPMEKVLPLTLEAHAIVCMFDPNGYGRIGLPNKLFEAMVSGRPIIVSEGTYVGEVVEKEKCGLVIPYTQNDLKNGLVTLKSDVSLTEKYGRNGLQAALHSYHWENQAQKLISVYKELGS